MRTGAVPLSHTFTHEGKDVPPKILHHGKGDGSLTPSQAHPAPFAVLNLGIDNGICV
jgi:hypothetical protein